MNRTLAAAVGIAGLLGAGLSFYACGGAKCDSASCSGCCSGNLCRPGVTDDACGAQGAACADCSSAGKACLGSVCLYNGGNNGGGSDGGVDGGGAGGDGGGSDGGVDGGGGTDGGGGGTGQVGDYCTLAAGGSSPCGAGWSCYGSQGAAGGICGADCSTAACPAGSTCLSNLLCVKTCTQAANCQASEICILASASTKICAPDCRIHPGVCAPGESCDATTGACNQVPGNQTFGQPCSASSGCQNGICISVSPGAVSGFCSQTCSATNPCPTAPAGAQCNIKASAITAAFCGWSCTGATACPTGLTCQQTPSGSYCQ